MSDSDQESTLKAEIKITSKPRRLSKKFEDCEISDHENSLTSQRRKNKISDEESDNSGEISVNSTSNHHISKASEFETYDFNPLETTPTRSASKKSSKKLAVSTPKSKSRKQNGKTLGSSTPNGTSRKSELPKPYLNDFLYDSSSEEFSEPLTQTKKSHKKPTPKSIRKQSVLEVPSTPTKETSSFFESPSRVRTPTSKRLAQMPTRSTRNNKISNNRYFKYLINSENSMKYSPGDTVRFLLKADNSKLCKLGKVLETYMGPDLQLWLTVQIYELKMHILYKGANVKLDFFEDHATSQLFEDLEEYELILLPYKREIQLDCVVEVCKVFSGEKFLSQFCRQGQTKLPTENEDGNYMFYFSRFREDGDDDILVEWDIDSDCTSKNMEIRSRRLNVFDIAIGKEINDFGSIIEQVEEIQDDLTLTSTRKKRKSAEVETLEDSPIPSRSIKATKRQKVAVETTATLPEIFKANYDHVLDGTFELEGRKVAKNLHVSMVPDSFPCRDEEFADLYGYLEKAISDRSGCYIAGTPGTGKTATVHEVAKRLQQDAKNDAVPDFDYVEINGMTLTDPAQAYSRLWKALKNEKVSPNHAMELLADLFSNPKNIQEKPCVVVIDELDILVQKKQSIMYNFFDWSNLKDSFLILVVIANTMDLPERYLPAKVASRMGLTRMNFRAYSHVQLISIIESRLRMTEGNTIFNSDAIQLCARKVGAVSGDARRALDICRRALEIGITNAEVEKLKGTEIEGAAEVKLRVTMKTIEQAVKEMIETPVSMALIGASKHAKTLVVALFRCVRKLGSSDVEVRRVFDEYLRLASLLPLTPATTSELEFMLSDLAYSKICNISSSRGTIDGPYRKCKFNINEEEIVSSFKQTEFATHLKV
ncbi:Origin recognition complex, subunit 1 [Nowakowskiella sp. JEL0078]|nr:Origin recognition complex, subunit 1 [Nowakowskiella sp. JEL0078]